MAEQYPRVATLRAQGWTLARIGQALGVSRQYVQQILRAAGKPPDPSTLCGGCGKALFRSNRGRPSRGRPLCLDCLEKLPSAPFSQRLLAFRLAARLTQRELASKSGVNADRLYCYETGRSVPTLLTLEKLVKVLGPGVASR